MVVDANRTICVLIKNAQNTNELVLFVRCFVLIMMPEYKYLKLTNSSTLEVRAECRDWTDYNVEPHVAYHRAMLSAAVAPLTVHADATHVPVSAVMHMATFIAVAKVVRAEFKDLVGEIKIANASPIVRGMYRTLCFSGLVGSETIGKITFC